MSANLRSIRVPSSAICIFSHQRAKLSESNENSALFLMLALIKMLVIKIIGVVLISSSMSSSSITEMGWIIICIHYLLKLQNSPQKLQRSPNYFAINRPFVEEENDQFTNSLLYTSMKNISSSLFFPPYEEHFSSSSFFFLF